MVTGNNRSELIFNYPHPINPEIAQIKPYDDSATVRIVKDCLLMRLGDACRKVAKDMGLRMFRRTDFFCQAYNEQDKLVTSDYLQIGPWRIRGEVIAEFGRKKLLYPDNGIHNLYGLAFTKPKWESTVINFAIEVAELSGEHVMVIDASAFIRRKVSIVSGL
jgi:hypothetical protein